MISFTDLGLSIILGSAAKIPDTSVQFSYNETDKHLDKIIDDMNQLSIDAKDTTYYFGTPFAFYYLFKEFDLLIKVYYEF